MSETEQLLAEVATLIDGVGGGGVRPKGGSHWFKINNGVRLSHRATGNRRLTGVKITGGVNVAISTGTTFNQFNAIVTGGDASIIAFRSNSTQETYEEFTMNIELPFADDPGLLIFIDNAGAQTAYVGLFWDYV